MQHPYPPEHQLLDAVSFGCVDWVKDLLQAGAATHARDENGRTPLHLAALQGDRGSVALLLEAGADVTAVDAEGMTALHHAARRRHLFVMQLLLLAGAPVDGADDRGNSPLAQAMLMAPWGTQVVEFLRRWGASPDRRNGDGLSPVEIAARLGVRLPERPPAREN